MFTNYLWIFICLICSHFIILVQIHIYVTRFPYETLKLYFNTNKIFNLCNGFDNFPVLKTSCRIFFDQFSFSKSSASKSSSTKASSKSTKTPSKTSKSKKWEKEWEEEWISFWISYRSWKKSWFSANFFILRFTISYNLTKTQKIVNLWNDVMLFSHS